MSMESTAVSEALASEAAEWFTRMQDPAVSHRDRVQFSEWLQQSARHVREYLAVVSLWQQLDGTDDARRSAGELLAAARGEREATNIIALHGPLQTGAAPQARRKGSRRPLLAAAAALSLMAAGVAGWMAADRYVRGEQHSTAVGEQRSLTLADGSVLRLNTRSKVRVRLDEDARDIILLAGEAMFEVAKDKRRPFRVHAGDTVVEAIGTSFNVYRAADATRITVLEGRIKVSATPGAAATTAPMELAPREQVRVGSTGQVATERQVNLEKILAWTDRRLIFEHETLAGVVGEFNRYNAQQLTVTDGNLAALRINGNFRATDPQSLVEFLERTEAVVATAQQDVLTLSRQAQ